MQRLTVLGIRRAILSGDVDQALEVTHAQFPNVLEENLEIVFRLKCQKWVELIRKTVELNSTKLPETERRTSNGFHNASSSNDDFAQDMELDEQPNGESQSNRQGKSSADGNVLQYDQLMQEVMEYGQELQREYPGQEGDHMKALNDIFSLIAYPDPKDSVNGHLLDPAGRVTVAEELNSAILGKSTKHPATRVC